MNFVEPSGKGPPDPEPASGAAAIFVPNTSSSTLASCASLADGAAKIIVGAKSKSSRRHIERLILTRIAISRASLAQYMVVGPPRMVTEFFYVD